MLKDDKLNFAILETFEGVVSVQGIQTHSALWTSDQTSLLFYICVALLRFQP